MAAPEGIDRTFRLDELSGSYDEAIPAGTESVHRRCVSVVQDERVVEYHQVVLIHLVEIVVASKVTAYIY
jgi:hypothetical protein